MLRLGERKLRENVKAACDYPRLKFGRDVKTQRELVDLLDGGFNNPEKAFRRGYLHGTGRAIDALEPFLPPDVVKRARKWMQSELHDWRVRAGALRPFEHSDKRFEEAPRLILRPRD
jgi:hypothetical protein